MRFQSSLSAAALMVALAVLPAFSPSLAVADEGGAKKVEVSGVLEAVQAREIATDTEHLGALKIKRLVDHGTVVSKDQPLVWFETEDVDKKIKEAETAFRLSQLSLEAAEFAHEQAIATAEIERSKAERSIAKARQDHENFMSFDRDRQVASAEFDIKNAKASLENATEEFEQLEQMYKEDDLTEESEEIVLKRAKQAVENAQFRLEGVEVASERAITQTLPNTVASQEEALVMAEMAYEKAMREFAAAAEKREIEITKARDAFHEEEKKLAELHEERSRVVLSSPIDGIALHGKLTRGRIGDKPSQLEKGTAVAGNQVVMTVVDPSRLQVRLDLNESQLATIHEGDSCTVTFPGIPELTARGEVSSVGIVPFAGSKYDCVVKLRGVKKRSGLQPLMSCTLTFEPEGDDDDEDEKEGDDQEDGESAAE
jgi:HlyD family secretion protein